MEKGRERPMQGPILSYLEYDHARLDHLLKRAGAIAREEVHPDEYAKFRAGLLRHIGLEERILFPAMARLGAAPALPDVQRIHLEHGAIASLLMIPPTPSVVAALRAVLHLHDRLEEKEGGIYRACEEIAGGHARDIALRLMSAPLVPVAPLNGRPEVLEMARRALARAGYFPDLFVSIEA
jgi:hypothetical protein